MFIPADNMQIDENAINKIAEYLNVPTRVMGNYSPSLFLCIFHEILHIFCAFFLLISHIFPVIIGDTNRTK